jgi:hypothetical protein
MEVRSNFIQGCIETGHPVPDLQSDDLVLLQKLAAKYIDENQIVKAQIALMEAERANKVNMGANNA